MEENIASGRAIRGGLVRYGNGGRLLVGRDPNLLGLDEFYTRHTKLGSY